MTVSTETGYHSSEVSEDVHVSKQCSCTHYASPQRKTDTLRSQLIWLRFLLSHKISLNFGMPISLKISSSNVINFKMGNLLLKYGSIELYSQAKDIFLNTDNSKTHVFVLVTQQHLCKEIV